MEPAQQTGLQIARGYQLSQALYVATKLGVADALGPQPPDAEAIAHAVGARASPLRRVLRARRGRHLGAPLFEYYATHPQTEASAAARMMARTLPAARELAASDVLRGARTLVDYDTVRSSPACCWNGRESSRSHRITSPSRAWPIVCVAILRTCRAAMAVA